MTPETGGLSINIFFFPADYPSITVCSWRYAAGTIKNKRHAYAAAIYFVVPLFLRASRFGCPAHASMAGPKGDGSHVRANSTNSTGIQGGWANKVAEEQLSSCQGHSIKITLELKIFMNLILNYMYAGKLHLKSTLFKFSSDEFLMLSSSSPISSSCLTACTTIILQLPVLPYLALSSM